MSQFDFPRLHFRGQFVANVGTANNDDLGTPQYVDSARVAVNTHGMTDAQFAVWLQGIDPSFGIRGGWNIFGDGGCRFQNVTCHATEPQSGTHHTAPAGDAAINAAVRLLNGVMVDQDPEGTTSTQIFADEFRLQGPGTMRIQGRPMRACSRWVGRRNLAAGGFTAFGAVWHSVIPPDVLTITPGNSPSLTALQAAAQAGKGVFIRYCTYLLAPQIGSDQLVADFAAGHRTANPAVGRVLGTIGVWDPASPTSFSEGHRLAPAATATVDHIAFSLNPATVQFDFAASRVSLDLIHSIPERDMALNKVDLGPLSLILSYNDQGTPRRSVVGVIPNSRSEYEARAGLTDFTVPAPLLAHVPQGDFSVVQDSTGSALLAETPLVIETDDRAAYLIEGESNSIRIRGWRRGQPAGGARITVRQFVTTNKTFAPAPPATPVVNCPQFVNLAQDGAAAIPIQALAPGCGTLVFTEPSLADDGDFFACVRVLPRDDYSAVPDSQITFNFIYQECLRYYHLLHPAMDDRIDLSDEGAVSAAIDPIRSRLIGTDWGDPAFMPRTRDLSAGKLQLLLRWCDIVSPS